MTITRRAFKRRAHAIGRGGDPLGGEGLAPLQDVKKLLHPRSLIVFLPYPMYAPGCLRARL